MFDAAAEAENLRRPDVALVDTIELVDVAGEPVADRRLVHYRLTLRHGPTRWACTQTLICKPTGERLATLDLLCSGFRELARAGTEEKGDDHA